MKKILQSLSLALLIMGGSTALGYSYSGKSFFSAINPFQLSFPERIAAFRSDRMFAKECGWGGAIQVVGFWQQSNDSDGLAKYFFPFDKCALIAGEVGSSAVKAHSADLLANYFGVYTEPVSSTVGIPSPNTLTFQSSLSMCPKHKVYGVGLAWEQRLWRCFWADVSTSIVQVQNKLNFKEKIQNAGGGDVPDDAYANMTEALASNKFNYGRFSNCTMKKSGFADVELRLGWEKDLCEGCGVGGLYIGTVIPTGNKPGNTDLSATATTGVNSDPCDWGRYIFQPIVGNNHHWGILFGSYGRLDLFNSGSGCPLTLLTDCTAKYLFSNCQKRSYDLKGKPWSRYIHTWNDSSADANDLTISDLIPLINYTTLQSSVRPGWSLDWNTALHYTYRCFGLEAGVNVFVREGENICITGKIRNGIGLADLYEWADSDTVVTESLETVSFDAWGNATDTDIDGNDIFLTISQSDLDVISAAAPAVFNGTFYGALSYEWNNCKLPVFFNGGGSYTVTSDNGAVSNWVAWIKVGVSF
ncbi:hypothetical protein A3F06_01390 [candidate division TM6 bacterium RIFCSPHIGHO2_12_FULL_36_22]|nr:MAG: hypothetical protein A3F06_01390 [candidate division TM6 bacterium RIFCSPHIGHO2_12_FULL_36_22]